MSMSAAGGPLYARLRDELAATGLVVVGVEFRNAAGVLGPHPFPAGLDDCTRHSSGGTPTASSSTCPGSRQRRVRRQPRPGHHNLGEAGRPPAHDGRGLRAGAVHLRCLRPARPRRATRFPSLLENDGYFIDNSRGAVVASVYDPTGAHDRDPLCWPSWAGVEDQTGLPPHVISVDELDPFRDEGLDFYRALVRAGVDATARVVPGVCHAAELMLPMALPGAHRSTWPTSAASPPDCEPT